MTTAQRDARVEELMDEFFAFKPTAAHAYDEEIEHLFQTTTLGFREIVLTIAVGSLLDDTYRAASDFYACNPRAIYEGPIRAKLTQYRVPHGTSGPLNVAKATQRIDEEWAAQRRPAEVARTVVTLVRRMERYRRDELIEFAGTLCHRLAKEAERIEALHVEAPPEGNPERLVAQCNSMIEEAPDSGTTPQKIVGMLLESYHEDIQSGIVVTGFQGRASSTNATSNKPGDIMEALPDGTVVATYEVTVKPFTQQRVVDSYRGISKYNESSGQKITEVWVICRPQDVENLLGKVKDIYHLGRSEHQDVAYEFINLKWWLASQLLGMPLSARLAFHRKLSEYIKQPNTPEAVKTAWAKLQKS